MEMEKLIHELHEWHRRNYPTETDRQCLLALGEELGELMRAELKQAGGIRGTKEHWQIEKAKECGDVLITVLEYAARKNAVEAVKNGLDYTVQPAPGFEYNGETFLLYMGTYLGRLMEHLDNDFQIRHNIEALCSCVVVYCIHNNFDVFTVLAERWNTISQRDFIANPETGGREKEDGHKVHFISAVLTGEGTAQ